MAVHRLIVLAAFLPGAPAMADGPDDWRPEFPDANFERTSIDYYEIVTDAPRRDQIPPIDDPRFVPVGDADISPLEPVLSVINEDWSVVARHVRFRADIGRKVECAVIPNLGNKDPFHGGALVLPVRRAARRDAPASGQPRKAAGGPMRPTEGRQLLSAGVVALLIRCGGIELRSAPSQRTKSWR